MKRIISRKRKENHLEIIIRVCEKEKGTVLETEIKKAIRKWNHTLGMDISFEILTLDDKNNHSAE